MFRALYEHYISIIFIGVLVAVGIGIYHSQPGRNENALQKHESAIWDQTFAQSDNPFHRSLVQDLLEIYYPEQVAKEKRSIGARLERAHVAETLSLGKMMDIGVMYMKFLLVYILVLIATYYGVQTIAAFRFILWKRRSERNVTNPGKWPIIKRVSGSIGKTVMGLVLFSPAYVIAYSVRTEFNTDAFIFLVALAIVSNGLLITYANKFYFFLVSESRKGYVRTAIVKNLFDSYRDTTHGISLRTVIKPVKRFDNHVFGHIFNNVRYQYLPTFKEQASFLITGLIIIEMALNVHGHLGYEMLRQLLYGNYDIVLIVAFIIFLTVKLTEIIIDGITEMQRRKFENVGPDNTPAMIGEQV